MNEDKAKKVAVERVIRNIIKRYGKRKFHWLLQQFEANAPLPDIAETMEVTKSRVWQWRTLCCTVETTCRLKPEVKAIIDEVETCSIR